MRQEKTFSEGVTLFKLGYEKGYIDGLNDFIDKNGGKFINF